MNLSKEEAKKIEDAQSRLVALYSDAGYKRAIELQQEIENLTGKPVFDNEAIDIEAIDCFHSGTWPVWHGTGAISMKAMVERGYWKNADAIINAYADNVSSIKTFVEKAEKLLCELKGQKERQGSET